MNFKKKLIRNALIIVTVLTCCLVFNSFSSDCKAKCITINKGQTYKINVKKGYKVKSSNLKVAKVTKKGKVTALKKGKCVIKVYRGKKVKKYRIYVNKKDVCEEEASSVVCNTLATPVPTSVPTSVPTADVNIKKNVLNGFILYSGNLVLDHIEKKDDITSYVYLRFNNIPYYITETEVQNGVQFIRYEVENQVLTEKNVCVGDEAYFTYDGRVFKHEIVGNTCIIGGKIYMCFTKPGDNQPVEIPLPTQVPCTSLPARD